MSSRRAIEIRHVVCPPPLRSLDPDVTETAVHRRTQQTKG